MEGLAQRFHPVIYGLYFLGVLVVTMVFLQPLCILCSWVSALLCWFLTRSEHTLRSASGFLAVQGLIIVLMAVGNMIFSSHGQIVLFSLGSRHFYWESALYGLCMGVMLSAVMTWFLVLEALLSPDEVRQLGGGLLPTVSLMLSMMLAYYPKMLARGRNIAAVTSANTAAFSKHCEEAPASERLRQRLNLRDFWHRKQAAIQQTRLLRTLSVLLGWSLEDSLIQANSMRARGYGSGKRSCFRRWPWHLRDFMAVATVSLLGGLAAFTGWQVTEAFSFYPSWSGFLGWYYYALYGLFMLLPVGYLGWLKSRCFRV